MRVGVVMVTHSISPYRAILSVSSARHTVDLRVFHHGSAPEHVALFYPYCTNRGLARSWNEGLRACLGRGADVVLLLNDDAFFTEAGHFDRFIDFASTCIDSDPDTGLVFVHGVEPYGGNLVQQQGYACGLITRRAVDVIGAFDENFSPAYYEDFDYSRRAVLSGLSVHIDTRVLVQHERGLTTRNDPELERSAKIASDLNLGYFRRKWGGTTVYDSCFDEPFGRFSNRISFAHRARPYGRGFDRDDLVRDEPIWPTGGRSSAGRLRAARDRTVLTIKGGFTRALRLS